MKMQTCAERSERIPDEFRSAGARCCKKRQGCVDTLEGSIEIDMVQQIKERSDASRSSLE